jgi:hypothetical protein
MIFGNSLVIDPSGWLLLFTEVKNKVRTQDYTFSLIHGCIVLNLFLL